MRQVFFTQDKPLKTRPFFKDPFSLYLGSMYGISIKNGGTTRENIRKTARRNESRNAR